jgi:hypothetical protein
LHETYESEINAISVVQLSKKRQLAHEEKNAVRAAYNRAEYLNERRTMMNQWADYIDAVGGPNVIPLQPKIRSE